MPTYRNLLERVMGGWDAFRRPLRREDREAFDRMMDRARRHSSAAGFNTAADPNETMFMSILLEHEKLLSPRKTEREGEDKKRTGGGGEEECTGDDDRP